MVVCAIEKAGSMTRSPSVRCFEKTLSTLESQSCVTMIAHALEVVGCFESL